MTCHIQYTNTIIIGATGFTDSHYGKPDKTAHLSNVACNGSEATLSECDAAFVPFDIRKNVVSLVDVVGVSCMSTGASRPTGTSDTSEMSQASNDQGVTAGIAVVSVLLIIIVIIVIR